MWRIARDFVAWRITSEGSPIKEAKAYLMNPAWLFLSWSRKTFR
jgi:hypothetical protein